MLKIYFGHVEGSIYTPPAYFDNTFEAEWMGSELVRRIVKDIDKSDVLSPYCIESPVLGQIPPQMLSGGTKTLILMLNEPETVFNGSSCGDNCTKWMIEIGKIVDVEVNFHHLMDFDIGEDFEIEITNNHVIVHNVDELLPHAIKYLKIEKEHVMSEGSL